MHNAFTVFWRRNIKILKHVLTQSLHHKQDVAQGQFFLKWDRDIYIYIYIYITGLNFPSSRPVAILKLKSTVCPTIYP